MTAAYTRIAFTPNVRAAQQRMGSHGSHRVADPGSMDRVALRDGEIEFIQARDSFYMATVGEDGWPYVQHRGGPMGFLKVLDERTIGFADYRGNRQYITVGNLAGDGRTSLFLMDYAEQRRLKLWGRARIVDEAAEPGRLSQLETPDYRARVERGIVITIEAWDWNCPQHITPRYALP